MKPSGAGNATEAEPTGTTYQNSMRLGGQVRTYRVHVPRRPRKHERAAVVMSFHGRAGTGELQERLTNFNALSDENGFIAVYPDGLYRSWNAGLGSGPAERRNVDDVGFVSALIDDLAQGLLVDRQRVYATGISNGAVFVHRLACQLSQKIIAIAPVAGPMASEVARSCRPSRPVPVLAMHGTADPIIRMDGTFAQGPGEALSVHATITGWVHRNGCTRTPNVTELGDGLTVEEYDACLGGAQVIFYRIQRGGHTWPGGRQYLPESIVGQTTRHIDASRVIWDFFAQRRLDAETGYAVD